MQLKLVCAALCALAWPLSPAQTSAATEADVRRYADTIKRLNLQLD
jgi:hypothetical protein